MGKLRKKDLKCIYVEWVDTVTPSDPWTDDEDLGVALVFTVGWLVKETDKWLHVALGRSDDGGILQSASIPKAWIKKRKTIKA